MKIFFISSNLASIMANAVILCVIFLPLSLASISSHYGKTFVHKYVVKKCVDSACPAPHGLYENPKDCCSYFNCANCYGYLQYCGTGTVFNPWLKICDWPNKVPQCSYAKCGYVKVVKHYKPPPKKIIKYVTPVTHYKKVIKYKPVAKIIPVTTYRQVIKKVTPVVKGYGDHSRTEPEERKHEEYRESGNNDREENREKPVREQKWEPVREESKGGRNQNYREEESADEAFGRHL